MAMMPVSDGLTGLAVGEVVKPLTIGKIVPSGNSAVIANVAKVEKVPLIAEKVGPAIIEDGQTGLRYRGKTGLDKAALDNRANQLNPNHPESGPGRTKGYKGAGTKADLDNRANQMNPNHLASGPVKQSKVVTGGVANANGATNVNEKSSNANLPGNASPSETVEESSGAGIGTKIVDFGKLIGQSLMSALAFVADHLWSFLILLVGLLFSFLCGVFGCFANCFGHCCGQLCRRSREYSSLSPTKKSSSIQTDDYLQAQDDDVTFVQMDNATETTRLLPELPV